MSELMALFSVLLSGDLQWRAPMWLWGLLMPFVVLIVMRLMVRKNKQGYADAHLWPWVQVSSNNSVTALTKTSRPADFKQAFSERFLGRLLRRILVLKKLLSPLRLLAIAWLSLMIAVAGPRSLQSTELESTRGGVDILVVMDLSHSMTATDVYPNRFLQAKSLVESLKNSLQTDDRLALMGYAGQPHLISPLSFDRDLFQHNLDLIAPDMLPTQGSWLELALIDGVNHLAQTAGKTKVMLVLTNGNPIFWQTPELPSRFANRPFADDLRSSQTGVKTILVGIGKPTPSTLTDESHKTGKLHANGLLVQSRLEELSLKKWAQNLQGVYLRGDESQAFLQKLLTEVTLPAGQRLEQNNQQNWQDFAHPFMVITVVALLFAFYPVAVFPGISRREKSAVKSTISSSGVIGGLLILSAFLCSAFMTQSVFAKSNSDANVALEQQAFEAYQNKDYEHATILYDQLNSYSGWMGAGSAAYKNDDLESAVLYFRQAALSAPDDVTRSQALFNLGNGFYLANLLPQAIESYQQALLYQSEYPQAKHNLALASERLKIEQANQKQGKGKNGDEDSEGDGDKGKGRGDDGAFYGGQKPSADAKEPGFGADGDIMGGDRSGEGVILPLDGDVTDYQLHIDGKVQLNAETRAHQANSNAIVERAKQRQRAEVFQQQLQKIDDNQATLLKRLFERESGFQAPQEKPHPIPGLQPW
ncbi:MAG: VWA domain-containing protein [Thiotrichales bacterium]|nr:VWA domain-containing protein [Thiotrichales bacterium]